MKKILTSLALSAAALGPVPAFASDAVPATAPVAQSDLDRLVAILVADDTMLDLALRAFDYAVQQEGSDAQVREAYAKYPQLKAHVAAALRPELGTILRRELPAFRAEIARIISAEMTPAEITVTAVFFASPTGTKLYANAIRSIGEKPGQSEEDARAGAMEAVMASMTPEDYPALLAFGGSPAAKKMNEINPRIGAASKAWAERLTRENQPRMRAVALKAAQDFMAKNKQ